VEHIPRSYNKFLHEPRPELLPRVRWWRLVISVGLDLSNVADKVHIFGLDHRLSVDELGTNVENGEEDKGKVVGDKCVGGPVAFEEDLPAGELLQ
jgi:hypothetical protein